MPLMARRCWLALALACWLAAPCASAPCAFAQGPTKGECIAANEAAQDLRHAGRLREARRQLSLCVADACPRPVREDCAQRLSEVDAVTPTILFDVRDEGGRDIGAVRVTTDGQPMIDRLDGTATPVDTGPHTFRFEADGFRPGERALVLREGDKNRRERIVLVPEAASAASIPPPPPAPGAERQEGNRHTQRSIGLALGGAGALAFVVGGILGITSKVAYDHALSSECGNDPTMCSAHGVSDVHGAYGQATGSTVAFLAGAVLAAGGAYFYFAEPKGTTVAVGPAVGPASARIGVGASW